MKYMQAEFMFGNPLMVVQHGPSKQIGVAREQRSMWINKDYNFSPAVATLSILATMVD